MARWRAQTLQDVTDFDGCGFGKYWVISFRLALLMPLKPSHNLLVRGWNPCGGKINLTGKGSLMAAHTCDCLSLCGRHLSKAQLQSPLWRPSSRLNPVNR